MKRLSKRQSGFTLIEMLVIAPIVILAIGAFITVIVSMTGEVLASRASNLLSYDIQDAVSRIEQDVKQSTSFLEKTNVTINTDSPDNSAQGYNDTASAFLNARKVSSVTTHTLILGSLVTNGDPLTANTGVVYLKDKPNACASSQVRDNTAMTMNVVYYVKEVNGVSSLWRRVIMPKDYANGVGCTNPWQRPSCTPGYSAAFCKTEDEKLVDGVSPSDFFVQYFAGSGSTVANTTASDPDALDADRKAALVGSPTVSVTVGATQTVAGRSVERSASIRATRLETNATTLSETTVYATPGTPVVSGNLQSAGQARFSWPVVSGGDVKYTAEYSLNGGTNWSSALSGSGSLSFTKNVTRNQNISFRVRGINSAGTGSWSAVALVKVPSWSPMVLQNNWLNYDPIYTNAQFSKTSAGIVVITGMIKKSAATSADELIATLPEGFRPSTRLIFPVNAANASGKISVYPNGEVKTYTSSNTWTSFGTITFVAADAGYTQTSLPLSNNWVTYGGEYDPPVSMIDSEGRVHLQGLIRNGTTTTSTVMATVPSGSEPSAYTYPMVASATAFGLNAINPSGGGVAINYGSATWQSLTATYYSANARTSGTDCLTQWCTLPLSGGWSAYDAARTPQYTVGGDGLVFLRGLIKGGTTSSNTVIGTLPAPYRPVQRIIAIGAGSGGTICRFDINIDGQIIGVNGLVSGYTALDNLRFMTD